MNPWPITPLTDKDLGFDVVAYDFTGLTAGELQDLPGLEAAIDVDLLEAALSVTDQTGLFDSVEADLSDLSSISDEMGGDDFAATVLQLAPTAAAGDAALADFTSLIGTGSSGGGGSSGASECASTFAMPPATVSSPTPTLTLTYTNNTGAPQQITSVDLTQDTPGVFSIADSGPQTIAAGNTYSVTVTANVLNLQGTATAKATFNGSDPAFPYTACFVVSGGSAPPPSPPPPPPNPPGGEPGGPPIGIGPVS